MFCLHRKMVLICFQFLEAPLPRHSSSIESRTAPRNFPPPAGYIPKINDRNPLVPDFLVHIGNFQKRSLEWASGRG